MHISELWRYPVKSLRGERCEHLQVDGRGVEGDRRYALVNGDGKFGSHKSTRRFVRMSGLFELSAQQVNGRTNVTFADGTTLDAGDPSMGPALSEHVGQAVTLDAESDVSHQDAGALHIITSASLRWLRERVADVDVRRFRPNLVVEVPGNGLLEGGWVGRTLRLGEVELTVTEATQRCVMTTLAQEELPKDPAVLRAIAQEASACFGVYASVARPGALRVGDELSIKS